MHVKCRFFHEKSCNRGGTKPPQMPLTVKGGLDYCIPKRGIETLLTKGEYPKGKICTQYTNPSLKATDGETNVLNMSNI